MRTASRSAFATGRLRVLALAVSLVLASFIPTLQAARAAGEDGPPGNVTGLQIVIETANDLTDLTAVAVGGGQGINLRAEPSGESEVLTTIPHGSVVSLRVDHIDTVLDASQIRWWPATWDGQDGWVSGQFLTQATTSDGEIISTTVIPFDYPREASAHSTAMAFGKGASVNVRAEPSITAEIIAKAVDGQVVSLRIDMVDTVTGSDGIRWWPVVVAGLDGWISGFQLQESNDAPTTGPGEALVETDGVPRQTATDDRTTSGEESEPGQPSGTFRAGDFVQVFTGDGGGVNLRSAGSLDAEVIGTVTDGQLAEVVSGPVSSGLSEAGWYEIRAGGQTGFVDGDFLVRSVETPAERVPQTPSEPPRSEEEEANANRQPVPAEVTEPETTPEPEGSAPEPPAEATSRFIYPVENFRRTQGFGCSSLPFYTYNAAYGCAIHDGLDMAAPSGTPLRAAGAGTVVVAGWCNCGLGYYVEIDHGDGIHSIYGHMRAQPIVSAGQQVSQGQQIGEVGSTGISTGPHVHFMIKVNGVARNPETYLP